MTDYIVIDTPADAATAMQQLNDSRGFSDSRTKTTTWATIETRLTDGKTVFIAPPEEWRSVITVPYTIEASQPDWFPSEDITPEQ